MAFELVDRPKPRIPTVNVKLTQEEDSILTREAALLGLSRSDFVRLCISTYLANK
mgnify:CR=1 FL=1